MVSNQGARRLRACILGVIPGDVIDAAVDACNQTLIGGSKEPLKDRVRRMTRMFQDDFGVPIAAIEKVCGCNADAFSEQDMLRLGKIYNSIKDGMAKREDYFDLPVSGAAEPESIIQAPEQQPGAVTLNDL